MKKQNIIFLVCDQFRFDCIHALGNKMIQTPNIDRLVHKGVSYSNAYSTCPVCVAARYTIMTGCEPSKTGCFSNEIPMGADGQGDTIEERCGLYLPQYLKEQGYRTFGIGKFHTKPDCYEDLGFEVHKHTEELWETPAIKDRDAYAGEIISNHPEYAHLDQLHGERTNMYYIPQMSPLPEELTVESFVAKLAIEEIEKEDERPYFGYISFIGPHPPCAPPAPYHLFYNPDVMESPYRGDEKTDFMDEQISFMNYAIWADDISDGLARNIRSRYYGEISYIDACIGRILDVVEKRKDAMNTMICFVSDHGDHMGDHGAWQKETFFEQSTKIPFIISAPQLLMEGIIRKDLICLTDLFAIATRAAGCPEEKDGIDVLGGKKRDCVWGTYGRPGTKQFKLMLRKGAYKYIFMANGGREQLFWIENTQSVSKEEGVSGSADEKELYNLLEEEAYQTIVDTFRKEAAAHCNQKGLLSALKEGHLQVFPYTEREKKRIHQFEFSKGIEDFVVSTENYFCSM